MSCESVMPGIKSSCSDSHTQPTAGANAAPVLGSGFIVAADGAMCQDTCIASSQTAAHLNNFYTDASTYLCAANVSGQAWVAGYQTTDPFCTITYDSSVINATEYACLCLTSEQTPGLEPSTGAESCDVTCAQTLDGDVGTAVRADNSLSLYTCLPGSEAGIHNRFGYADDEIVANATQESIPCTAAAVSTTSAYSCFCTFEPQSSTEATVATATQGASSMSGVATAGRKLLF